MDEQYRASELINMKNQNKRHRRWFLGGIFTLGLLLSLTLGSSTANSFENLDTGTNSYPRNQALYVTMRDGTKIAIDVWLPKNLSPKAKIPTIMRATLYQRTREILDKNIVANLPPYLLNLLNLKEPDYFNNAGYALVLVDARGRGASFGTASTIYSPDEIKDYNEIVNWIVAQPWSNHKVGAYGTSYDSNTAELLAATNNPAVKAIVPRFGDFDLYAQFFPGGIFNEGEAKGDSAAIQTLDVSPCSFNPRTEYCENLKKQLGIGGVKPVDEDKDKRLLAAAVQQHAANTDLYKAVQKITYRDDSFGQAGLTSENLSPYNFKNEIERSKVAIYSWGGWLDGATPSGVISRFMTYSNPQKAVIGAWNHGAFLTANPYSPPGTSVKPSVAEQYQDIIQFFDKYLKNNNGKPKLQRELKYYTMVEEQWKTTNVWPPDGVINQRWFLAENNNLTRAMPTEQSGEDNYTVNFEAGTGEGTRWQQDPSSEIIYANRAVEDKKLLTYNSAPLKQDVEITGNAVAHLYATSTADDGAFIVYLEDVEQNGKVTYITEGELRPLHRKISDEMPPYTVFGPNHSFKRKDGLPLVPGQVNELSFNKKANIGAN